MNEHRKEERKKLTVFTPVHDVQKDTLLGYIADLTSNGALLIGERPAEVDMQITLAIDFPETPESHGSREVIPARVAWCKREPDAWYYDTGVEFHDINQHSKVILDSILGGYQNRQKYSA
ncbi:MAG: PilZ domain-containing protein [Chloroflexota bacterium]